MKEAITIGVDLAKNIFQVHGVDAEGALVVRRQLRRARVLSFFKKQAPDLPPRLVPVSSLDHARRLTSVDFPVAPQTRRVNRRGVARSSVGPAACIRARCAA